MYPRHETWGRLALLTAVSWGAVSAGMRPQALAASDTPVSSDVLSRMHLAPAEIGAEREVVEIFVNGVHFGQHEVTVDGGKVTLSVEAAKAVRLTPGPKGLDLSTAKGLSYKFDEESGILRIEAQPETLSPAFFDAGKNLVQATSKPDPEICAVVVNYDVNARRQIMTSGSGNGNGNNSGTAIQAGGLVQAHGSFPDFLVDAGLAYNSQQIGSTLVRLDTTVAWRPPDWHLTTTFGDLTSQSMLTLPASRPYRFLGVAIGTDYTSVPGWSSAPVIGVSGTAQVQSNLDVYINSQRIYEATTSGGKFTIDLPPGLVSNSASVAVTDVTGRTVLIPVDVPRSDANLIRTGLFLWSAGVGLPRFDYGIRSADYWPVPYAYATGRYGLDSFNTVMGKIEGGAGVVDGEIGLNSSLTKWMSGHVSVAGSQSRHGMGGNAAVSMTIDLPYDFQLQGQYSKEIGKFNDIVSITGEEYDIKHHTDPLLNGVASSTTSARISWQPTSKLSLSASYDANTYQGEPSFTFASFSANYEVARGIPLFLNFVDSLSHERSLTAMLGVSFSFGSVSMSASGGYADYGRSSGNSGPSANINVTHGLGNDQGDIGWQVAGNRTGDQTIGHAGAEWRSGYGIPGVSIDSYGGGPIASVTAQGSVGIADWHPFVSDPVQSGLIVADAGVPGVPMVLNSRSMGETSWDGKMVMPDYGSQTPQHVAIVTDHLDADIMPGDTEKDVTVRPGSAAKVSFGSRKLSSSAIVMVRVKGNAPPLGSVLSSIDGDAVVDKKGRAYVMSIADNEVLVLKMPNGSRCNVATKFSGHGGPTTRLGPLDCGPITQ